MNKSPKEKAKELFDEYYILILNNGGELWQEIIVSMLAKNCALFAIIEILEIKSVDKDFDLSDYWQEVEREIYNL
jgi:hypothetical protein